MEHAFLVGERIYLRPIEEADISGPYLDWLNDPDVRRFLETGNFPTNKESAARYIQATKSPENVLLAIVERTTKYHIGNIKLGPIHWLHRRSDMGILIGPKECRGKGYGTEAVSLILHYGFERLNLHKITLGVYADHTAAVKLYERLGFRLEGKLREHLYSAGTYHDKYVMSILRQEFEARAELLK